MASSYRRTRGLAWAAIGVNLCVFAQWKLLLPPAAAFEHGRLDRASPAYRAAQARHQQHMRDHYTLSARNLAQGRWHTLLTSAFSHADAWHLGVNMFMLHQAAGLAAGAAGLGAARAALLALGAALGGAAGALASDAAGDPAPRATMGASAMVQGVLVATACAVPRLPVHVMFIPVAVSYRTVVGGFLAWDLYGLYAERTRGRTKNWTGSFVAYGGHLGGAVFGGLFYLLAMRRGRVSPFRRL